MKSLTAAAGLLALGAIFAPPAHGQDLTAGLWSGEMTPPGGDPLPVMFEVGERDGALRIVMMNEDLGPMDLTEEALEGDELTFAWNPGVRVECTLMRQDDGSFDGICADERGANGGEGRLTMIPPEA
ncbi:MAG: hypothetical protein PVF90_06940 [Gemmatimonadota bacterium]|jgi:hypothetical protein